MSCATQSDRTFLCEAVKREVRRQYAIIPQLSTFPLIGILIRNWPEILQRAERAAHDHIKLSLALAEGIGARDIESRQVRGIPRGAAIRCRRDELRRNIVNLVNGHPVSWPVPPDEEWPDSPSSEELNRILEAK